MVKNPFRTKFMRESFDSAVKAYANKQTLLFSKDGNPYRGNSWAVHFWRGFDGSVQNWDYDSKQTSSYAFYRAGQEVAKSEK